ncbi:hypothetical protein WJX72_002837 [[Myrmecia] bisecta]|uniref:AB hydrolase-1 domain-containing protein n=1 Tax=[Myrmecia] bisecta TaxID=41462 RepID=A0AAW1PJC8_9CHLO
MSRCPTIKRTYKRLRYLFNGHVETIFAAKLRDAPLVEYERECVQMEDGGTVAIDTEVASPQQDLPADAPVLILLPGLTGGSHDAYVRHMVGAARSYGIRAVVFNSRGTSDSPVTSPQFYSASFTGDMREVVRLVRQRYPDSLLLAAGWSLGANILVRYLGEEGDKTPIEAAVSMCNPFNLVVADQNFHVGFNRIYDHNLANSLRAIYAKHAHLFEGLEGEYQPQLAARCRTIREFDDALTRCSFGWPSVDAYYAGSSSSLSIPHVKIPLLCIQAADDPIAPAGCIPYDAIRKNSHCLLAVTPAGGHLGWCSGPEAPLGAPWTDQAVVEFLTSVQPEYAK